MSAPEAFTRAYVECALWSSSIGDDFAQQWARETGEDEPASDVSLESFGFTADDIAPEALESIREDCTSFYADAEALLSGWSDEQAGHDFWLTRNGHGTGFWDRGRPNGDKLSELARPYGTSDLYVGDDGKVYVS